MSTRLLDGLVVLLLEDEYLIAMDVEHLCLEHGAREVVVVAKIDGAKLDQLPQFDVGIIDLMLEGSSTLPFAEELKERGIPFVFASGYPDKDDLATRFDGVPAITKPYAGNDLIEAAANTYRSRRSALDTAS